MIDNNGEYILCAAIWYKDLTTQTFLPKNIDRGLVVCGHRHGHCIDIMSKLGQLRSVQFGPDSVGESEQGFLTNTNRFVDRLEALEIAKKSNQLKADEYIHERIGLFSENLY
jgi:hypothetical protein